MELIIFPYHDWRKYEREGARGRDTHIIKEWLRHKEISKILIVNRPVSRAERLKLKISKFPTYGKIVEENTSYRLSQIHSKAYVFDCYVTDLFQPILYKREWWAKVYTKNGFDNDLKKIINKYFRKAIFYTFNPFSYKLISAVISKQPIVYDIFDDFSQHPRFTQKEKSVARKGMKYLTHISTKTIAVTKDILKNIDKDNVTIVNNGFSRKFLEDSRLEVPYDLINIPKPIIGYSGRISKRIDIDIVKELAVQLKNKGSIVFIGEIYDKNHIKSLSKYKNVYFLGAKRNECISNYIHHFDVAMVPHIVDKFEKGGNSIKIYEYLACGKQVVTTKIGGIGELHKFVNISKNKQDFIELIVQCTKERNIKNNGHLRDVLINHSWETKADTIVQLIKNIR